MSTGRRRMTGAAATGFAPHAPPHHVTAHAPRQDSTWPSRSTRKSRATPSSPPKTRRKDAAKVDAVRAREIEAAAADGRRHPDAREDRAPRGADRLHLQDQVAAVRARDVRDHQRHRAQRRHRARAAPPVRDLHQLQEHGPLPVDRRADPHHVAPCSARAATSPSWSRR